MTVDPDASARKLVAKRINERVKLFAGFLNALAIGVVGTALIVPVVQRLEELLDIQRIVWCCVGMALHLSAQAVFSLMRSED